MYSFITDIEFVGLYFHDTSYYTSYNNFFVEQPYWTAR